MLRPDGVPQYLIGVIRDHTDRKRHEQRIAHMAHYDALTDLPNRAAFAECIAATVDLAATAHDSFAVLCIDLDRFKEVNDVFGGSVGDALLSEVARRLQAVGEGAFVARVGGDEFDIITPTGPQPATAEALAGRVCAALDGDIEIDGHALRVGLTIGIGVYPQDGADANALMANADAALYRAKSEARGTIRFFEVSMDKQLREQRVLQQDLRTAIGRNELALHYQPQALMSGEITGLEALARWHHPRHGIVPPATFIPWPKRAAASWCWANGSAHRLPRGGVLAAAAVASPSTCHRCSSSTATCPVWCIRCCSTPAWRRRGWSWRSPRAC